jgi:hypothetical protein
MADRYGPPPLELDPARQRRRNRVVVRSPDPARRKDWTALPPHLPGDRRRPVPTLIGLGEPAGAGPPDCSAQSDGLDCPRESSPRWSRPAVLREGVDDALAEAYRAEAARILASGVFALPRQRRWGQASREMAVGQG